MKLKIEDYGGKKDVGKNLNSAIENIEIIKNSISDAEGNYKGISKVMLVIGVMNLIYYVISSIGTITLKPNILLVFQISIDVVIYLISLIYYVRIYMEERSNTNRYYISILNICAVIIFLIPILLLVLRMISFYRIQSERLGDSLILLQNFSKMSNMLLVCFIIIVSGYVLRKKYMIFISTAILFLYLAILLIYNDVHYTVALSGKLISISLVEIYYCLVTSIGYIIIAMILNHGGHNSNGNK